MILGAGVSGLTSGIVLLQNGYTVKIWAKDLPPNTTSNKAAAVWYPYLCFPREKAIPWALATFNTLQRECLNKSETGCIIRTMTEFFDTPQPEPWWKDAFPGEVTRPVQSELPEGYVDAYQIESIVIDTSLYMEYLMHTFAELGGIIEQREVTEVSEALAESDLVVNCTGLGSRALFRDEKVFPVRGQMIKVRPTGFNQVVVDDEGPNVLSLVVPRVNDIMLGGTVQVNDWNLEVDPEDSREILRKVKLIAPELGELEIIREQVGLRPVREEVRLEAEDFDGKTVIHNYGHGGAGFTLSWGCAQDVLALVQRV